MHPMLTIAVKAARNAAKIITRASFDVEQISISRKGPNDYVTEVDHAAEQIIIDTLREAYPDHAILAEESGLLPGKTNADGEYDYTWIIDPLDGTTNFIHGYPTYAISIALMHKNQISQAVIYDPNRNDLFTATRGAGAFLNDRRIRVSKPLLLSESLIGATFHDSDEKRLAKFSQQLHFLSTNSAGFRRSGSAVLDLAYVASGRLDAYFAVGLKPWDMAAGALMVLEAGGLVSDFNGEQDWLKCGDIVCAPPKTFPKLLQVSHALRKSPETPTAD